MAVVRLRGREGSTPVGGRYEDDRICVAVTAQPSAAWTLQQRLEVVGFHLDRSYLIHNRDRIFVSSLDESIGNHGWTMLASPPHSPQANAICERLIGATRRECLD